MTIHYKVIKAAQPGVKGGGSYQYYARINNRKKIELDELAGDIANSCTLRKSDVYAVLIELTERIPDYLLDNCSVQLGQLGIFSLHAQSRASETEEEVNETKITNLNIAFRPGSKIKERLKPAKFSRKK